MRHIVLMIPAIERIGGTERQVLLLATGFAQRGWRVTVIALSGSAGASAAELSAAGIGFVGLEMRKGLADPRGWLRLNRWLARNRPEILHAHLPHAAWMARWSRLAAPVPVVVDTIHTTATGTIGRKLGYRLSKRLPDAVTAVSKSVARAYEKAGMVSPGRLRVVPNGIDVERWCPDPAVRASVRTEMGLGAEFLWIAAGRLEAVKDYPTLLRAFAKVPAPARLVIAGTGPLESALRQLAAETGVSGRVRFLGFEPDLRRSMQAADGLVLSSLWEGLPMVLLEAAACGVPAVATDVPGTQEALIDGQTGLLAAAGDADALASAMDRLMRITPEARREMGDSARRLAVQRYSLSRVLDRWEPLFHELLTKAAATNASIAAGPGPSLPASAPLAQAAQGDTPRAHARRT